MNVKDCMTSDVQVITPATTIQKAAQMMRDGDFGALPVGENDRLVGMITDRDIAICAVADGKDVQTRVGDVMSDDVIYCFEDDSIEDAADQMGDHQVRRLMVLNNQKRFVGMLSLGDIAQAQRATHASGQALSEISEQTHRDPGHH